MGGKKKKHKRRNQRLKASKNHYINENSTKSESPINYEDKQQEYIKNKIQLEGLPRQSEIQLWFSRFWKTIVGVSVLLGLFVSFLAFSPSVTVVPTESLDVYDPLATPFIITNESLLPIHSVKIFYYINEICTHLRKQCVDDSILTNDADFIPVLLHKEQKTFLCPPAFKFPSPIEKGDIVIQVLYRPAFLFWHRYSFQRFVVGRDKLGVPHWYPMPVSAKNSN